MNLTSGNKNIKFNIKAPWHDTMKKKKNLELRNIPREVIQNKTQRKKTEK